MWVGWRRLNSESAGVGEKRLRLTVTGLWRWFSSVYSLYGELTKNDGGEWMNEWRNEGIMWMLSECRFVYRSEVSVNGSFTSPNFPGLYPRHTQCHYLFYGAADQRVFISFQYFDVEGISPGYVHVAVQPYYHFPFGTGLHSFSGFN